MIRISHKGNFKRLDGLFEDLLEIIDLNILENYGKVGVRALEQATPKDTGVTAYSWYYEIEQKKGNTSLVFKNSHMMDDTRSVAIVLQYGHATKNGSWVEGRDYINPAIQPVFDDIAYKMWEEVIK